MSQEALSMIEFEVRISPMKILFFNSLRCYIIKKQFTTLYPIHSPTQTYFYVASCKLV